MRNSVMYMEQIEILLFRYRRHLRSQRQRVRLMLEQRIRHHLYFMKTHALVELCQTRRQSRGNEVDCVAASGQLLAQLRTDYPAAAVSWINSDADVHKSKC